MIFGSATQVVDSRWLSDSLEVSLGSGIGRSGIRKGQREGKSWGWSGSGKSCMVEFITWMLLMTHMKFTLCCVLNMTSEGGCHRGLG